MVALNCNHHSQYFYWHGHCPPANGSNKVLGWAEQSAGTPWWHYVLLGVAAVFLLIMLFGSARIIWQGTEGVVFRFGKVVGTRKAGIAFKIPLFDNLDRVNVKVVPLPLQAQQVITKDSVSLSILAVAFYKVTDPVKALTEIENYQNAIEEYGQSAMRALIGRHELSDVLHGDKAIVEQIKDELDHTVESWGIEITKIELKDIDLPEDMQRAMAAKAESKNEAEAKVIAAKGELDSAEMLNEAANKLSDKALELRRFSMLREIADERSTIIVESTGVSTTAQAAAGSVAGTQQQ